MCGISAYLGINNNAIKCIISSLKMLQNRGYDSAGICIIKNNILNNVKFASDNISSIEKLENKKIDESTIAISHTRWATHGPKNDINAHPHIDYTNRFAIVHNGIIENYYEIKQDLINHGINFKSETDTEVIINLISYNFTKTKNLKEAIKQATNIMEGTWGIVIMDKENPNTLFATCHGSPLIVGTSEDKIMITSEISGFCNFISYYTILKENIIHECNNIDGKLKININNDKLKKIKKNALFEKNNYPYWTIKEIMEQPSTILRTLNNGARIKNNYEVKLGGLELFKKELFNLDHLIILGCGTSLNAGNIGKYYFENFNLFDTVSVYDGAEFTNKLIPRKGTSGLLLLSQSGETKDLHRCIKIGKENDLIIISIVNVVDSMIAREADCGIYLNVGREIGVASTKSFTSQVIVLSMISIWFAQYKNVFKINRLNMIKDLRQLSNDVSYLLNCHTETVLNIAKDIINLKKNSLFVLGKSYCQNIAIEGALKIKEISYIHAEGYSGSALKHGPFALLEKNTPVIFIAPNDENFNKMLNSAEEVKSRYAKVYFITDKDINNMFETVIKIPENKTFSGLLGGIILQLVAYNLAILKGINPDFPKNLAKVVTVE